MEAKTWQDTVVHADGCTTNLGVIGATCNCGATQQAEITAPIFFKAGQEEERKHRLDRPKVLFHKVVHIPEQDIVNSISKEGITPQVASEYKDLVPEVIRDKPIVWLASKLHSYTDAPVFLIKADALDIEKLHPVKDTSLDWWVYEGTIPSDQLLALIPGRLERPELREEIARLRHKERKGNITWIPWDDLTPRKRYFYLKKADATLALTPNEEAIRKEIKEEFELKFNPDYLDFKKGVEVGKEEGRKDVVEWMEELCPHTGGLEEQQIHKSECPKCWQAQRKVWGIK